MFTSLYNELQGSGWTSPDTQGISVAKIALDRFSGLFVVHDDLARTILSAQPASNAGIRINDPGTGPFIQADGLHRTDVLAKGILALFAQDRFVDQIFPFVLNTQSGQPGIEPPAETFGADKLTNLAPGTQIEMCYKAQTLGCLKCLGHKISLGKRFFASERAVFLLKRTMKDTTKNVFVKSDRKYLSC
jgi:hypothetical protein